MSDDDNITQLNVRFKSPPSEADPMLKVVAHLSGECNHQHVWAEGGDVIGMRMVPVQYLIREGETEVECGNCHTKLDPMWVLKVLANKESRWYRASERYQDEMKRLAERSRTKCDHCGHMTRISRR